MGRSREHAALSLKRLLEEAAASLIDRRLRMRDLPPPSRVYCIVHAPWTTGKIAKVKHPFNDEVVTRQMLSALAHEALSDEEADVFDASVARVHLNGYPVAEPEGKRAMEIALSALITSCDDALLAAALEVLQRMFPQQELLLRSGTRAVLAGLEAAFPRLQDAVILDLSDGASHALWISDGAMTRETSSQSGLHELLAHRHLPLSASTTIHPRALRAYGELLEALRADMLLPNLMVLIAPRDAREPLTEFLIRPEFSTFTLVSQPFDVVPLNEADLRMPISHASTDMHLALSMKLINKEMASG